MYINNIPGKKTDAMVVGGSDSRVPLCGPCSAERGSTHQAGVG